MKQASALLAVVLLSLGMTLALDAEAKRLGGARSSGMQRQQATQPAHSPTHPANTPSQSTAQTPAAAAAPTAAAPAKRGWAGALTGLAAGLGLVALASYFGFGEALANAALVLLAIMAVLAVVGLVMRRRAATTTARLSPAFGGAAGPSSGAASGSGAGLRHQAPLSPPASTQVAGFDATAFSRIAKAQFMALQEANDARDLQRLRSCFTPEMFEAVREEVQSRGDQPQRTEVFGLDAQVIEAVEEPDRHVVSVRFTGSVREQPGAVPEDLDEIWHLTRPRRGDDGWRVAGIQQVPKAG